MYCVGWLYMHYLNCIPCKMSSTVYIVNCVPFKVSKMSCVCLYTTHIHTHWEAVQFTDILVDATDHNLGILTKLLITKFVYSLAKCIIVLLILGRQHSWYAHVYTYMWLDLKKPSFTHTTARHTFHHMHQTIAVYTD